MESILKRLKRLTPIHVGAAMGILTLFAPFLVTPAINGPPDDPNVSITVGAILWYVHFGDLGPNIQFLNILGVIPMLIFAGPMILYAVLVVRYCQGKTTKILTLCVGVASVVFPLTPLVGNIIRLFELGRITYFGLIPIQFFAGLFFMGTPGPPEMELWEEHGS